MCSRIWVRHRQGLSPLQEALSEILHGAGDHHAGVGQIEALSDGSRKIEGFRNHHLAGCAWKVESNMIAEHALIILHAVGQAGGEQGVGAGASGIMTL